MLIRIFCKFGEHHREDEFSYTQQPVEDEVLVHTWRDATFNELTELLAQEHREIRQGGTKYTFKVVFPQGDGKWIPRNLGSTMIGRRLPDDISTQTLAQARYQVGDFMSVAIYPPRTRDLVRDADKDKDRVRSEAVKREVRALRYVCAVCASAWDVDGRPFRTDAKRSVFLSGHELGWTRACVPEACISGGEHVIT